jgi:hypothetical protein
MYNIVDTSHVYLVYGWHTIWNIFLNWIFVSLFHFLLLCVACRCYECGCEIAAQCRKKLHECVEFIKRQEETHARSKTSESSFYLSSVMTPFYRSVPSQGYGMGHEIIIFGVQMTLRFSFRGTKVLLPIMRIFVRIDTAFKIMYYVNKFLSLVVFLCWFRYYFSHNCSTAALYIVTGVDSHPHIQRIFNR